MWKKHEKRKNEHTGQEGYDRILFVSYIIDIMITAKQARRMRQNVNELESYSLRESANTLPYDMIEYARNRWE